MKSPTTDAGQPAKAAWQREVLEPAIFYAREGQPLVERASETIATVQSLFRDYWKTSADLWMPDGRVPKPATLVKNPALAATYERILNEAGISAEEWERAR